MGANRARRGGMSADLLTNGYPATRSPCVAEMAAGISEKPPAYHVGTEYVLYMVEIEREIGQPWTGEAIPAGPGKARCALDLAPCCPYRFADPEMDAIFDPRGRTACLQCALGK
jgi:hypothetical protein